MSSGNQISTWARKNQVQGFLGVFASDELPASVPSKPWSLVCNYQNHASPGDHWTATFGAGGRSYWFSSFGLPPDGADSILGDKTSFRQWLNSVSPKGWTYNKEPLQSLTGDTCGNWSVYACKVRGGPRQRPKEYGFVGSNKKKNDLAIMKLVRFDRLQHAQQGLPEQCRPLEQVASYPRPHR